MPDLFSCPAPTALASIPATSCPVKFEQIQKMAIQRIQSSPSFSTTSILLAATWTALLAAADSTKVIITPFMRNVVIPPSEPLFEGGNDNTTLNGIPLLRGIGTVRITAQVDNISSAAAAALRALASESSGTTGSTNLWAYFFNKNGQVISDKTGSTTALPGFKIYNLVLSDVGSAGFAQPNTFNLSFDMEGLWSNNFQVYTPTDFNSLTLSN